LIAHDRKISQLLEKPWQPSETAPQAMDKVRQPFPDPERSSGFTRSNGTRALVVQLIDARLN
jgi:hypothetical protein